MLSTSIGWAFLLIEYKNVGTYLSAANVKEKDLQPNHSALIAELHDDIVPFSSAQAVRCTPEKQAMVGMGHTGI